MAIKQHTFNNGLRVVYQKNTSAVSALEIFVKVGSINEPKHLGGISHFIEHMVFKGTKTNPESNIISQIFDSKGAYINAHTLLDHTVYTVKCDSSYLEVCMKTLIDMVFNSLMEKNEVSKERGVVVEEIKIHKDNPVSRTYEAIYKLMFGSSGLGRPVGGTPTQIKSYKYSDVVSYYKHFYVPQNMVISVCTNIPFKRIIKIIKNSTNNSKTIRPTKYVPKLTFKTTPNSIKCINTKLEKTYMAIGFTVCNRFSPDYFGLDILRIILTGNMSSLLFMELREKNGLTYTVGIDFSTYDTVGNFVIITNVDKNRVVCKGKVVGAVDIIINIFKKLKLKGITQHQLKIAKGYLKGVLSLSTEDTFNLSNINGQRALFNNPDKNIPLGDIYEKRYKSITLSQINSLINKYFIQANMSSVYLGSGVSKKKSAIKKVLETL